MLRNKTILTSILGVALLALAPHGFAASEFPYDSGNRRDPFVPLSGEENTVVTATSSGVKLEGIIYDPGDRSMAILNGKAYQKGESVGDVMVVKIFKDHVVISVDGEEKILWIREEEKT
ncbi:MAG: hypothetical protein HY767_03045 [Candidatus Omnitrophica bacterium]|nr:hypothetical protein [Candidatus Omnitrophota bacterium]